MSGPGGILAGALALIALEVVASSSGTSGGLSNVGSLLSYPGQLAAKWMSPTIALIPASGSGAAAGEGGEPLPAAAATTPAAPATSNPAISTLAHPS